LPTLEELRAISAAVRTTDRDIAYYGFVSGYYWTSTPHIYDAYYIVRMSDGHESYYNQLNANAVRCVRGS
jgi:hypothetical protein